ncbi:PAS domain S-box protein [Candidatus Saganbacteria bacterium]|nr:PAS domain S-box protein [Candidatus Saganbacteria bacterium]
MEILTITAAIIVRDINVLVFFSLLLVQSSLGLYIFLQNLKSEINLSFAAFCGALSLWTFSVFMLQHAQNLTEVIFWGRFIYIGPILIVYFFLYFTFVFPKRSASRFEPPKLILFLPALIFLMIVPGPLILKGAELTAAGPRPLFGYAYPFFMIYFLLYFIYGILNLIRKYGVASGIEKNQIRYVFLGLFLTFLFSIITNLILPALGEARFFNLGPLFTIFVIGFTTYAVVKHRLMSIELIIQRSTVYIAATLVIMALYTGVVIVSEIYIRKILGYTSLAIAALAALFIAVLYQPLVRIFQNLTDRIFFKGRYDYQKTLKKVSQAIATKIKMEELTRLIVATLVETMGISEISFLINDRERERFRSVPVELTHAGASRYKRIELDAAASIIKWLKKNRDIMVFDEIKSQPEVAEEMERLGVAILVPIISQEELIGALSLGNKLSGDIFTSEDIGLLLTLANQTAVALDNARLFEEVVSMKEYNEEILNSMVSGVLTCDNRGKIITFNPMAEKITGYKTAEVLGRTFGEAFPQKSALSGALESTLKGRNLRHLEASIVSKERGLVPVSLSTCTLHDLRGKKSGALLLISDLTEVKELENKVRRADKLGALGTMAAGMAHEIKNPLSSMKVLSQLLPIKYQDEEFRGKFIEIMPREISRIDRIVESLLGFARATSPKFTKLNIQTVLMEDLKYYDSQANKSGVEIVREFQDVPEIEGDPDQLPQVFSNLILNAIQAMPEGGKLKVVVREGKKIESILQNIVVEVSDTGHGITPANLARLFDPFFTTKYAGTGLGLTIAHSIVDGHRGTIDVKSEIGRGTNFIVTLPLSQELV